MAVDQPVAEHRRTHIHRHIRVLPNFSCCPLRVCLLQTIGMSTLACSRDDEMGPRPEWGHNIFVPFVGEWYRPEFASALRVDTHDRTVGQRHYLLLVADIDGYRRSITRSSATPFPFLRSGSRVKSQDLTTMYITAYLHHEHTAGR